jgi:hypothetical protein
MLTFMTSGRFTKTHAFCNKNGNLNIYEAKPETLFGRDVCNEEVLLRGHLGGKAKLNHI